MPNDIITSAKFEKFNQAMMGFLGEHPVLFHVDERNTLLQEDARYFAITFAGKLLFPVGYTSQDCINLVKKLKTAIIEIPGGNIRANNTDWVYRVVQPGEKQSPYVDVLIAYSESDLTDRQIREAKERKLV